MATYTEEIKLDSPLTSNEKKRFENIASLAYCTLLDDGQTIKCNHPCLNQNAWNESFKFLLANVKELGKTASGTIYVNVEEKQVGYMLICNNRFSSRIIIDSYVIIAKNQELKRNNELLRLEINYAPEEKGAMEAREHFESLMRFQASGKIGIKL